MQDSSQFNDLFSAIAAIAHASSDEAIRLTDRKQGVVQRLFNSHEYSHEEVALIIERVVRAEMHPDVGDEVIREEVRNSLNGETPCRLGTLLEAMMFYEMDKFIKLNG